MTLAETGYLAISLMEEHGLNNLGWRFEFDNAKRRFGCCNYTQKRITLSKHLVVLNEIKDVKDTILHEIAHALVGRNHGHNHVWMAKAKEIGCNGKRCYDSKVVTTVKGNYEAVCPHCKKTYRRFKRPKIGVKQSCGICSNGKFNLNYFLVWNKTA
jgi:predicted SprT family Zn-dependent metalloprotease